jgi:nitroreductase
VLPDGAGPATSTVAAVMRPSGSDDLSSSRALRVPVDLPLSEAARRATTRPEPCRFDPLQCIDAGGAVVGAPAVHDLVLALAERTVTQRPTRGDPSRDSGYPRRVTLPLNPDDLLTTTRTVRKRLDLGRPVPIEVIRECLQVALQAPSGSNRQHWEWVVVTDPQQRAAVAGFYRQSWNRYQQSGASASRLYADDPVRQAVQQRVGESGQYLADRMQDVPVLVIPCVVVGRAGLPAGNQAGVWGSILPAAWSYCLAARARGLGTAWTTLHLDHEREVAEVLGIPDTVAQAALIPTAYYTGDNFRPAARQPLDDVLHLDRW